MNTTTLETFLVLSNLLNFSRTAEELLVAQSTVTNRILDLERELGQELFVRSSRSLKLTEAGRDFLNYARRIIDLEKAAFLSLNNRQHQYEHLHIGSTNTIHECYLKRPLRSFLDNHPQTATKLTIGHSGELLRMLEADIIDCVLCYQPLLKSGYLCHCFDIDDLVLVCNAGDHTFAAGIEKKDLKNLNYLYCNFILQDIGIFIRQLFPLHHQFSFEIDNSVKLLDYVLDGSGYTFLPYRLVAPFVEAQKLNIIPLLDLQAPKIYNYYIKKKEKTINCDFEQIYYLRPGQN